MSGIVGLGVGDFGLFAAYVLIGPRLAVLVMASSPIFASVGAYFLLGETFPLLSILGIALTVAGIIIVLADRKATTKEPLGFRKRSLGLFSAVLAAMGQGFGLVLSKKGMYLGVTSAMNPVSAALIRMILATMFIWILGVFWRKQPELQSAVKNRKGMKYTVGGALVGPFAGMTLSMVAVAYAQAGIAQTLMSLSPVIIIPVIWLVFKETTNRRGILGAVVAVLGVAILFLT